MSSEHKAAQLENARLAFPRQIVAEHHMDSLSVFL
jgi:hypothetical protein